MASIGAWLYTSKNTALWKSAAEKAVYEHGQQNLESIITRLTATMVASGEEVGVRRNNSLA